MRRFIKGLVNTVTAIGRNWIIFLVGLLLACLVWLFHVLSQDYNEYMKVNVIARTNMLGRASESSNSVALTAKCNADGFDVLYNRVNEDDKVSVYFDPSVLKHLRDDIYYITSDKLGDYERDIFGDDVSVTFFLTDTLFFKFPQETYKKVPVIPVYSFDYEPQYVGVGDVILQPDSVYIYGQPHELEMFQYVNTFQINEKSVSTSLEGMVRIDDRGLRLSESETRYRQEVTRFAEIKLRIPDHQIKTINVPEGKRLTILTQDIYAIVKCEFAYHEQASKVNFYIDYNEFNVAETSNCVVKILDKPHGVISCEVEPFCVHCVLEDVE